MLIVCDISDLNLKLVMDSQTALPSTEHKGLGSSESFRYHTSRAVFLDHIFVEDCLNKYNTLQNNESYQPILSLHILQNSNSHNHKIFREMKTLPILFNHLSA